jgi:uncharacterized damage-inducible protein DinB
MNLLIESLHAVMLRDLDKLKQEIEAYTAEATVWLVAGEIKNPAGNLCLHLCGNLQHYLGAVLGNSGYVRHREAEFNSRNVPKEKLIQEIEATRHIVSQTLQNLEVEIMEQTYPEHVFNRPMSTGYFLIHLAGHLNYHLGQINYHRRLTGNIQGLT